MSQESASYNELSPKDISELRKLIDPISYKRSMAITWFWCILDVALYLIFIYGAFTAHHAISKIVFGFLAGIAASSMFVLAHDMAHGALFKSKLFAEVIGTIFMLPALNVYRLWSFGHNRVHHGFTSFSPIDWIWRPLTINEYNELGIFKKIFYRVERSVCGCGLHYLVKVWWTKMMFFMPDELQAKYRLTLQMGKSIVWLFAIALGILAYHSGGGFIGLLSILVVPFLVFNYVISFIVYLHHTHPDVPFFDERSEWNQSVGAIFCTTVIYTNWIVEKFITHNILIHTPHHIDIRIPFYQLKVALDSIKSHYSQYVHEYRLSLPVLLHIFRNCKLYDYKEHVWYTFKSKKIAA